MQDFPPPHFFSPRNIGGLLLRDCFVKALRAAVQFRSDVSKRVSAEQCSFEAMQVFLLESATFVPFGRVFSYPSPHPIIVSQIFTIVNNFFKKI